MWGEVGAFGGQGWYTSCGVQGLGAWARGELVEGVGVGWGVGGGGADSAGAGRRKNPETLEGSRLAEA